MNFPWALVPNAYPYASPLPFLGARELSRWVGPRAASRQLWLLHHLVLR